MLLLDGPRMSNVQVMNAVADLGVFIGEAKRKLEEQAELFKRMDALPNWRRGLTG